MIQKPLVVSFGEAEEHGLVCSEVNLTTVPRQKW